MRTCMPCIPANRNIHRYDVYCSVISEADKNNDDEKKKEEIRLDGPVWIWI